MTSFKLHRVNFFELSCGGVLCAAYSQLLDKAAISRDDDSLELWNTRGALYQESRATDIDEVIKTLCWAGERLLAGCMSGQILELNVDSLSVRRTIDSTGGPVWSISASPTTNSVAVGNEDGGVRFFDTSDGYLLFDSAVPRQNDRVLCVCWNSTGTEVSFASVNQVKVWSVASKRCRLRISVEHPESAKLDCVVWQVVYLDDVTIATGDSLGRVMTWSCEHGTLAL